MIIWDLIFIILQILKKGMSFGKQDMMSTGRVKSLKPNARVYATDACVPITNLVECIKFAETEISKDGWSSNCGPCRRW